MNSFRQQLADRFLDQVLDRFIDKVQFEPNTGCWIWNGAKAGRSNYAQFTVGYVGKQKHVALAHRFAYQWFVGRIPDGLVIDHLCDVPACVNPDHLRACTQKQNVMRSLGVCAKNAVKTHCPQGHKYTPENTKIDRGKRSCRRCNADRQLRYMQKREVTSLGNS